MNVKKYLKEQAKKDYQELLDANDGELLRILQEKVDERPKKHYHVSHFRAWIAGAATALAAIIVVVCVLVFYPQKTPIVYLEENFESIDTDLDSLNRDLHDFFFSVDTSLYSAEFSKTIDSLSGDTLFYEAILYSFDSLIQSTLIVVCNKNFKYNDFHESELLDEMRLPSYSVLYQFSITSNPTFGINTLTGCAAIHLKNESVFVTNYQELMIDDNGSFFDIIQSIIQVRQ